MSVTITLNDNLVAQLQAQAEARHLSVEALALHILEEAVTNRGALRERRLNLVRDLCGTVDGRAAERLASTVMALVAGREPAHGADKAGESLTDILAAPP